MMENTTYGRLDVAIMASTSCGIYRTARKRYFAWLFRPRKNFPFFFQ